MKLLIQTLLLSALVAETAELIVTVKGVPSAKGTLGCALFDSPDGFPMGTKRLKGIRHKATTEPSECRFEDLKSGRYAVAVSVDTNDNGKTDTNFLGIPTEAWGVSNNARPKMRAPKFDEAAIELKDGETKRIEITVSK